MDVDDLTDTANLLVILFAIVAPFSIAFRYFMKAKNKYYLYKARHADTLVQHTHSTNRGATPPPPPPPTLLEHLPLQKLVPPVPVHDPFRCHAVLSCAKRRARSAGRGQGRAAPHDEHTTCRPHTCMCARSSVHAKQQSGSLGVADP